jgi:hypothetical protein
VLLVEENQMKLTREELFVKLVKDYKIIGEQGVINFSLKHLTIALPAKDTVGNLLFQWKWLQVWMKTEKLWFEENINSPTFPDFYLVTTQVLFC